MEHFTEYWIPWTVSNGIAILILVTAIYIPKMARILFALLFGWASILNYITIHSAPESYLIYADLTPIEFYAKFINSWFKEYSISFVTIIAILQGMIGIGFLIKGWVVRLSCIGAILFFVAITPLGIGSAFPATLVGILSLYIILKRDDLNPIWHLKP